MALTPMRGAPLLIAVIAEPFIAAECRLLESALNKGWLGFARVGVGERMGRWGWWKMGWDDGDH